MSAVTKPPTKQIVFRVPEDMYDDIDEVADALGLTPSSFLRMLLTEQMPTYKRRAEKVKRGERLEEGE